MTVITFGFHASRKCLAQEDLYCGVVCMSASLCEDHLVPNNEVCTWRSVFSSERNDRWSVVSIFLFISV